MGTRVSSVRLTAGASAGAWQVTYEKALEAGLMTKLKIKKGTSVTYGKQLVKVPHCSPPHAHLFPSPPLALFLSPLSPYNSSWCRASHGRAARWGWGRRPR